MNSSKERVELLQRPSASSEPEVSFTRGELITEKLWNWSRSRKLIFVILASVTALAIWTCLISLQISSFSKTNSHDNEISELKLKMALVIGELDNAKSTISNLQAELSEYSDSLKKLQSEDVNLANLTDALKKSSVNLGEKLTVGNDILALEIEKTQLILNQSINNAHERLSELVQYSLETKTKIQELDLEMDFIKVTLNDSTHSTGHHINMSLSNQTEEINKILSKIDTVYENVLENERIDADTSDRVIAMENKLKAQQLFKVGDIKYSVMKDDHDGWLICDGRSLSKRTYQALYSLLGTQYGSDDHGATFNIMDARGRSPLGAGQSGQLTNRRIGQIGGEESTFLDLDTIPDHKHNIEGEHKQVASKSTFGTTYYIKSLINEQTSGVVNGYFQRQSRSSKSHNTMHPFIVFNTFIYSGVTED